MRDYTFYVYVMQSVSRRVLYIGMTSDLRYRVWQHKNHVFEGFTDKYNCTRLVYFEAHQYAHVAIARETQLKKWRREKKEWLIVRMNPHWKDLSEDWGKPVKLLTPIV